MDHAQPGGSGGRVKNILIAVLLCIALGEFALLLRKPMPAPAPTAPQASAPGTASPHGEAVRLLGVGMDP